MRLLVSCIPYDGGKSGISTYVREVVRELAAQGHELTLLVEPGVAETDIRQPTTDIKESKVESRPVVDRRLSNAISAPRWTRRAAFSMLWHLFVLPFWIRRHRKDFDGFVICAANRRVCAWYPLPTAATVHDLANFHIPGKYSRLRMFYLAHMLPFFAKRAQHLVAVSGATKADMVKYWHCRESAVTVLYNGLQLGTQNQKPETRNYQLSTILYISRIEHPGKNHVRLIEAYGRLPRELAEAHPLVIAGADWKDAETVHAAAKASPNADLIRFTGFVEDIEALWREAGYYVFPSLFEGFGLSLVEAMSRGIPCACSNNGSLGEIAADVAITFDPESVEEIADALLRLVTEPEQDREERIARGMAHVKKFSWSDHARGIVALIDGRAACPQAAARVDGRAACPQAAARRVEDNAPYHAVNLFGIPVAKVTESEAVERIIAFAKQHATGKMPVVPVNSHAGRVTLPPQLSTLNSQLSTKFVATLNVDFVSNAVRCWPFGGNDELCGYLKNADLVTADGMPIVLLSKLLRNPLPERVTGADMVPAICRRCAEEGLSVYVLGGDRDAIEAAFGKLRIENGELKIAGIDPAFVKLDEDQPEIVARINAAQPDILFVALGNPKQELWMGRNRGKIDVGAMIGVGGTFNFIAGKVKRAPRWMQRCGLEWIYRIIQEPGRLWRRYAYGLVKFAWLSLRAMVGRG